uniref:Uncharacterized protein n=1 Tax=Triticum urartu TaxID=4572 RepID=A0A8R7PK26_TRIUA
MTLVMDPRAVAKPPFCWHLLESSTKISRYPRRSASSVVNSIFLCCYELYVCRSEISRREHCVRHISLLSSLTKILLPLRLYVCRCLTN